MRKTLPHSCILLIAVSLALPITGSFAHAATPNKKGIPVMEAYLYTDRMPLVCDEPPCKRENPHLLTLTVGNGKQCFTKPILRIGKTVKGTLDVTVKATILPAKKGCMRQTTVSKSLPDAPARIHDTVGKKKFKLKELLTY